MPNLTEIVCQGWLTKSPPTRGIFRPRWRKRWFVLKGGNFIHQFVLEYYTDDSMKRLKGGINLDECMQIIGPLAVQERHKHTFQIHTTGRTYYLAAENNSEMLKWVTSLCQVCALKSADEESDAGMVFTRTGDENNKPRTPAQTVLANGVRNRIDTNESDDSSPTLSNKLPSGPYIPISECFTGKPMPLSSTSGDVTYSNSSVFQFPPKVNWATHPSQREHTDSDATPTPTPTSADSKMVTGSPAVPPPRPPKSKMNGSPVSVTVTSPPSQQASSDTAAAATTTPTDTVAAADSVAVAATDHLKSPLTPCETEDTLDSSSTCSSLHSPPSSAGAVYCNISEIDSRSAAARGTLVSSGSLNANSPTSPSELTASTTEGAPPPVVDRNLKPLRNTEPFEAKRTITTNTTSKSTTSSYASGTMTLPSRGGQYNSRQHGYAFFAGPVIDRSRKPPDGHLSLGPTPAQMKSSHGGGGRQSFSTSQHYNQRTLPSSPHRRAGPVVSPNERRPPVFHEYEQANEMKGTYLQIECQNKDAVSPKFPAPAKTMSGRRGFASIHPPIDPSGSVEYRLIDPVKTKALNRTIEDREKQLRSIRGHH
ncbi:protein daughter of sevenless [Folsomia candida]|uniref:GRB2-associated-binding protein 2 n=1 Tax=Folsomia candida TaxID=158441 RepID=A0A226DK66_FOLCA|nr:protein daughter of sevenless [Folsomia candida]OXA45500.1 GRB2-associated-binding protein 2 [Folsomia candida]